MRVRIIYSSHTRNTIYKHTHTKMLVETLKIILSKYYSE